MSAFQVTDVHLSAMVQGMGQLGMLSLDADDMWIQLYHDNAVALFFRYNDELVDITEVESKRTVAEAPLDLRKVYGAAQCWSYQCAEWKGYEDTYAHRAVTAMIEAIEKELGEDIKESYEAWSVTTWADVVDTSNMGVRSG